jgi:hypothetical protein
MDAFVLAPEVKAPVLREVAVADDGAQLDDGLGPVEAGRPSGRLTQASSVLALTCTDTLAPTWR